MDKYNKARAEARGRFEAGWRPARLLRDNTKLVKADRFNWKNLGLSLAPAATSGYQICASASPICSEDCIFSSGRGRFENVQWGRIARTLWFFEDRETFMLKLYREIANHREAAIRLNVFSDWMWERQAVEVTPELAERYNTEAGRFRNLMEVFPETQFYDYTKHFNRMFRPRPANYHLTFSLHETNGHQAIDVLRAGMNVAAVVTEKRGMLFGYPIIDGDDHDLRFLDPENCVVGLKAKGSLATTTKEMIYVPDPEYEIQIPDAA